MTDEEEKKLFNEVKELKPEKGLSLSDVQSIRQIFCLIIKEGYAVTFLKCAADFFQKKGLVVFIDDDNVNYFITGTKDRKEAVKYLRGYVNG